MRKWDILCNFGCKFIVDYNMNSSFNQNHYLTLKPITMDNALNIYCTRSPLWISRCLTSHCFKGGRTVIDMDTYNEKKKFFSMIVFIIKENKCKIISGLQEEKIEKYFYATDYQTISLKKKFLMKTATIFRNWSFPKYFF